MSVPTEARKRKQDVEQLARSLNRIAFTHSEDLDGGLRMTSDFADAIEVWLETHDQILTAFLRGGD